MRSSASATLETADLVRGRRGQGRDRRPYRSLGRQHAAVAVTVRTRGRYQCRQPLDEFQRREDQGSAPVRPRLGQRVQQSLLVQALPPLQGKRPTGTIAQQAFDPGLIGYISAPPKKFEILISRLMCIIHNNLHFSDIRIEKMSCGFQLFQYFIRLAGTLSCIYGDEIVFGISISVPNHRTPLS